MYIYIIATNIHTTYIAEHKSTILSEPHPFVRCKRSVSTRVRLAVTGLSAVQRIEVLVKWRLLCTRTNDVACPCIGVVRLIVRVHCMERPLIGVSL